MPNSRRRFMKTAGAALGAAGLAGLAGCTDAMTDPAKNGTGDGGSGPPGYTNWLYDPSTLVSIDNRAFATFDVSVLYDNEEHLPEEFFTAVEEANEGLKGVDLTELSRLTGVGFAEADGSRGGGSVVASGSFDPDTLSAKIEEEATVDVSAGGSYEGYELYTYEQETSASLSASGSQDDWNPKTTGTVALSEEHVVVGMMRDDGTTGRDTATAMIDAGGAEGSGYYAASADAKTIVDELEGAALVVGLEFEAGPLKDFIPDEERTMKDVVDDLTALGLGTTVDGDTMVSTLVLVYDAAEAASAETVRTLIDELEEDRPELGENLKDVAVSEDGRAVVLSVESSAEEWWSDYGNRTGVGTGPQPEERPPMVQLSFEQRANGRVKITHDGGDHVTQSLLVEYTSDGSQQVEFWEGWSEPIAAGDSYTTDHSVDAGTDLTLTWPGADGEVTLGQYTAR